MRVGRAIAAQRAQKRENMVAHDLEHFLGLEMLEPGPAAILISYRKRHEGEWDSKPPPRSIKFHQVPRSS